MIPTADFDWGFELQKNWLIYEYVASLYAESTHLLLSQIYLFSWSRSIKILVIILINSARWLLSTRLYTRFFRFDFF